MNGRSWAGIAFLTLLFLPTAAAEETSEAKTFTLRALDPREVVSPIREMTGLEDIVVDADAHTLVVRGSAAAIRHAEVFLQVFDNQQTVVQEIRVFRLEHISTREATTLVRKQLQVRACMDAPERQRIAVRDTPERLDQAAALLASSDVSTN